jgi:hypothetical protein
MKTWSISIILIVSCVCVFWTTEAAAAPNIEFEGGVAVDFGDVEANTTLEHMFVFTNTGDQVLQIHQVKGG